MTQPSHAYEVMSKEPGVPSCSHTDDSSRTDVPSVALCHNFQPLPSPTFTNVLPAVQTTHVEIPTQISDAVCQRVDEDCEGNKVEKQRNSAERYQLPAEDENRVADDHRDAAERTGRYEYMDIRHSDSSEGEDRPQENCETSAAETEEPDRAEDNPREEEEEEKCHHTNNQPTFQGSALTTGIRPDVLIVGERLEEYEEMATFGAVPAGWEQPDYQNLPVKGSAVSEEVGSGRCGGIGGYIKVCAGIGEPGSSTSFDNPDYWHSRLFVKPDAVRT